MYKLLKVMLKLSLLFFITAVLITTGCNQKNSNIKSASEEFDMQTAKSFIDSINTKFSEQIKNGDSIALASHYSTDAAILLPKSEPIKGKDILSAWGSMLRAGTEDISFQTIDLAGNNDFLIETGYITTKGSENTINKSKYLVVWKKQNGEWKLYRDMIN
jgi:ketosteroid isomerase-like protein